MKKLVSFFLAAVMTVSMAVPVFGEALTPEPEAQQQELVEEQPPEDSPDNAAEILQEPDAEPSEVPVEEPAEEPAGEPVQEPAGEPAEEPAEEPVQESAEEPVQEPAEEPVQEPAEEPAEKSAEEPVGVAAVSETQESQQTVTLYLDEDTGVYFGNLDEIKSSIRGQGSYVTNANYTFAHVDDSYWVFCLPYNDTITENDKIIVSYYEQDGSYVNQYYPLQVSQEQPAVSPSLMIDPGSNLGSVNPEETSSVPALPQTDTAYSVTFAEMDGYTMVGYGGADGLKVMSADLENREFTISYTNEVYEDNVNPCMATYWRDEQGILYVGYTYLSSPGNWMPSISTSYWDKCLSESGQTVKAYYTENGQVEGWSRWIPIESVSVQLYEDWSTPLAFDGLEVSYDRDADTMCVRMTRNPIDELQLDCNRHSYQLRIQVTTPYGGQKSVDSFLNKRYVDVVFEADAGKNASLGTAQGAKLSGKLTFSTYDVDSQSYVPVTPTEDLKLQLSVYDGFQIPEGETIEDYISAEYNSEDQSVVFTALKDISLTEGAFNAIVNVNIAGDSLYDYGSTSFSVGLTRLEINQYSVNWTELESRNGATLYPSRWNSETQQEDRWASIYGRPTDISVEFRDAENQVLDLGASAWYDAQNDMIHVNVERVPGKNITQNTCKLIMTVTFEDGSQGAVTVDCYRGWLSTSLVQEGKLPRALAGKEGEVFEGTVYLGNGEDARPLTSDEEIIVTPSYANNIDYSGSLSDYVEASLNHTTGLLTVKVLKDLVPNSENGGSVAFSFSSLNDCDPGMLNIQVGRMGLSITQYNEGDLVLKEGQQNSYIPMYQGDSLQSLGLEVTPTFWVGHSTYPYWNDLEPLENAGEYFGWTKNADGSVTITVLKQPPFVSDGTVNTYFLSFELDSDVYYNSHSYSPIHLSTPSLTMNLKQNGKNVHVIPAKQGIYTFDVKFKNDNGEECTPAQGIINSVSVTVIKDEYYYPLSEDQYAVSYDPTKGQLTLELKQDIESGKGNFYLWLYTDLGSASNTISLGKQKIGINSFSMSDATTRRILSYCFESQYDLYLPTSELQDDKWTITAKDNNWKPMDISEYADVRIEGGYLVYDKKKSLPQSIRLDLAYEDDTYIGSGGVWVSPQGGSNYYYITSVRNMTTGEVPKVMDPGTTAYYRVELEDGLTLASLADQIQSIRVRCNNSNIDTSQYVDISLDKGTNTLAFTWKGTEKLPLFNEDKSVRYTYALDIQAKPEANVSFSSYTLFDTKVSSLYDTETNTYYYFSGTSLSLSVGSSKTLTLQTSKKADEDYSLQVMDAGGQKVDPAVLSAKLESYGAITIQAGKDCKPNTKYTVCFAATYDNGGSVLCDGKLNVSITEQQTIDSFRLQVRKWNMDGGLENTSLWFSKDSYTSLEVTGLTTEITCEENQGIKSFSIEGLTLGTMTQMDGGWRIQWTPNTSGKELREDVTLKVTTNQGVEAEFLLHVFQPEQVFAVRIDDQKGVTTIGSGETIWNLNRVYKVTPIINGQTLAELGYKLRAAFLDNNNSEVPFEITSVAEESFNVVPVRVTDKNYNQSNLYITYEDSDGEPHTFRAYWYNGNIVDTQRTQFVQPGTSGTVSTLYFQEINEKRQLTVNLPKDQVAEVSFGTNLPGTVHWEQDPNDVRTVTVSIDGPLNWATYFYALITLKDGSQTSAYARLSLSWSSDERSMLPNGYRLVMGTKSEDGAYNSWSGTNIILNETNPTIFTGKWYVFYQKSFDGSEEYQPRMDEFVKSVKVESLTDGLTILRQGEENGMWFYEYQYTNGTKTIYKIRATATLLDGSTRTSDMQVRVVEQPERTVVNVSNSKELDAATKSASLLPGTSIILAEGLYEGDFTVDMPVTISSAGYPNVNYETGVVDGYMIGDRHSEGARIQGSITAKVKDAMVLGIHFIGQGGTAVRNFVQVGRCIIEGYDVGAACEDGLRQSTALSFWNNVFENNKVAVRFFDEEWHTYANNNVFKNNDVALEAAPHCDVQGTYTDYLGRRLTRGTMNRNRFFLHNGQLAINNLSGGTTGFNLSYNYFKNVDTGEEAPEAAMFNDKNGLYTPYYETYTCEQVKAGSVDDNVEEGTTTSTMTLVAAQGSSNSQTADSSLELSGSIFDELQESEKADELKVNVMSTSGETDVTWTFKQDDLKEKEDGEKTESVNLGVAFTFTDFEYDMVDNVVKKSTESIEQDPETGEPVSKTLGDIAYQAMCFSHSGELPGKATVEVRMNESLVKYYRDHNNSFADFKVYYLNTNTGKLELMDANFNVVERNGVYFYTMTLDHCSSYIITTETLKEDISGLKQILAKVGSGLTIEQGVLYGFQPGTILKDLLDNLSGGTIVAKNKAGEILSENALVGTGSTLGLGSDGTIGTITVLLKGDTDGDGKVGTSDLIAISWQMLDLQSLDEISLRAATVASHGTEPKVQDIITITQYMLGLIPSL